MIYYHADVFSEKPLTGNALTVMLCDNFPENSQMQAIAKEMRQYETIFLCKCHENTDIRENEYETRIFTPEEELPFAGHPVLGAAAVVHALNGENHARKILFHLPQKDVTVDSDALTIGKEYQCCMNQGRVEVLKTVENDRILSFIEPLRIKPKNLSDNLPLEVCTTGLAYLIIPVKSGIERAGIFTDDYEETLRSVGAKFTYVMDTERLEVRTWDNAGWEDAATGSAAGPAGDYLIRHGICRSNETIILHQGRFTGRPSSIHVRRDPEGNLQVSGKVHLLGKGIFEI